MRSTTRQARVVAGRRREANDVEPCRPRRPAQLVILLGRQIDHDQPIDAGRRRIAREALGAIGQIGLK